ncbi:HdeD family acid-resistance protein [Flavilitoribacter nigricans]|uniref:HdeD family acid-resistance protein n=1 Tax=Flavilitoribacter nigricans (strain ATCC 23147 / DSM 23189 / NBRC 102662 / NCIMB 1420 / SS-2) TaxID=1122177 RepID=A0A2D0NF97_FLAN2|nr:DUF308 domain-containing protein [Flavilitoribacter nigricans]PHN07036.1 hypothetical protein CRP01_08745 [Flavilitoribacter nigricans DSM 23189 = NBRC 102662]
MTKRIFKTIDRAIKYWYVPLIVGLLLLVTGIWTLFSFEESFLALSLLFSISFLVSGLMDVYFAISHRHELDNWGWSLVLGIFTAIIGFVLLTRPELSMITLPLYVGFGVLFRSIMAIGWALELKNYGVLDWGNLMIIGTLGALFSFILLWNPLFAGMTIVFWTAMALIITGGFNIYLAGKLRSLHRHLEHTLG